MSCPHAAAAAAQLDAHRATMTASRALIVARPVGDIGKTAGETKIPRSRQAATFADRLRRYHRTGRGGSPAHKLAGQLLTDFGLVARVEAAALGHPLAARADRHLETAGIKPAPDDPLAAELALAHREEARVVLRRMRWAGDIDAETFTTTDAALRALGLPERIQPDLPLGRTP